MDHEKWQWQKPGRAWKGVGLYHVTLTIPSRQPLLGKLVIPNNDASQAYVKRTELGETLVNVMFDIQHWHREIQILQFVVMPDHIHTVWYVRRPMKKGILSVVQGFWTGAKKLGRAYSYAESIATDSRENWQEADGRDSATNSRENWQEAEGGEIATDSRENWQEADGGEIATDSRENGKEADGRNIATDSRENYQEADEGQGRASFDFATVSREDYKGNTLRLKLGDEAYYALSPVFTEKPFLRPMGQRRQLQATIRYIDMNPQRLATKKLRPGFFRVQHDVGLAGRKYDAVGNIEILQADEYKPVHVRSIWVEDAERHGDDKRLRDYMNGCVIAARNGAVMVSPFISPKEKAVLEVLLLEEHRIIYIADNGFGEYYKPSDGLFDAVAAGRMLILSPWQHDAAKRHVTRAECVAMNGMAEEICSSIVAK